MPDTGDGPTSSATPAEAAAPTEAVTTAEAAAPAGTRGSRWRTWGVVAAGVCCLALAASTAFRMPTFFGADEPGHFAYVVYVIEGRIPEVGAPLPTADERFPIVAERVGYEDLPSDHRGGFVYVANHPPLFYLLAAGPARLAANATDDTLPPLTVRLVNATCMAVGVLLVGRFAGELFGRWPGTPVVAAGLAAVTANVVGVGALGHNDGLAMALSAGALLLMARLLRRGPEPRLVVAAALLGAACALTRAGLAVAVAGLVLATFLGAVRRAPVPLRRIWSWPRAWSCVAVAVVPVAAAGWFYLRNQNRYGSFTADGYLLDHLGREPTGSTLDVLGQSEFHEAMWRGLYGSVHPLLAYSGTGWALGALVALIVAGGTVGVLRHVVGADQRHGMETGSSATASGGPGEGAQPLTGPVSGNGSPTATVASIPADDGASRSSRGEQSGIGVGGWLLFAGYALAVVVSVANFVGKGGGPHPRYFLVLVPLVSALVAGAIGQLPFRRIIGAATLAGLLAVTVSQLRRYDELIETKDEADALWTTDPAAGTLAQRLAVTLAAAAFVAVLVAIRRATRRAEAADEPSPPPPSPVEKGSTVPALDAAS